MKFLLAIFLLFSVLSTSAQTLQLHYDLRHTLDPKLNPRNFLTLYFEYYKTLDTGKAFIKPGSFLLKTQADFAGDGSNIGKYYMQISQEFRLWKPKIFMSLQYSGGLGVTNPRAYSYYIFNTYSAGISYHYKWGSAYLNSVLYFKYVPYKKPSNDLLYTFYFYKGLLNYKAELSGDFSVWTENKNHGDELTSSLHGKRFFFFAEPQLWYNFNKVFSLGTKINMNYHVLTAGDELQIYPTAAIRLKF